MNKLFKRVMPLVVASASIMALASCNPKTPVEEEKTTITFWTNFYQDQQVEWMDKKAAEFEDLYPQYEVVWEESGDYPDIQEAVNQVINTPTRLPSLAVCYPDYVYSWLDQGAVMNFDDFMNNSEYGFGHTTNENGEVVDETNTVKDDMSSAYISDGQGFQVEGTYSMPFARTSEVMYYNSDVFTEKGYEVPTNWNEMITLARQMRADYPEVFTDENKGNAGSGAVAPIGYDSYDNMMITFAEMMGVPLSSNVDANKDGTLTKDEAVLFNNDEMVSMLSLIKGWYDEGLITVSPTLVFDEPYDHWINEPFTSQTSFMVLNSTTGASWCATDDFVPGVAPMPAIDKNMLTGGNVNTSEAKVMSQGPSVCMFDKGDEENKGAWLLYKFLTNTENNAELSLLYGAAPIRASSYEEDNVKEVMNAPVSTTGDGETDDSTSYMTAQIYDIYADYTANNQAFIAPVSQFSSAVRDAVGTVLVEVLRSTLSGEELTNFIKEELNKAYENI